MVNNEISTKRQIITMLERLGVERSIKSVYQLTDEFTADVETADKEADRDDEITIKDFTGAYLTNYCDDGGIFGDELAVFHIEGLKTASYNTDYERMYSIKGTRISFSNLGANKREMEGEGNVSDFFSEKRLRRMKHITETEFDTYEMKANQLNNMVTKLIKDGK